MSSETREDQRPHYVNELPEGYPEDTPRCRHVFSHAAEYRGRNVRNRPCGLPVVDDAAGDAEQRCAIHTQADRDDAEKLAIQRREIVASAAFVGATSLEGASLVGARMEGIQAARAVFRNADLRYVSIGTLELHDDEGRNAVRQRADLREADFRGALLTGARIAPEADLSQATFDQPMLLDEQCAREGAVWERVRVRCGLDPAERPTLAGCEALYRQLKLNYQESGEYTTAGDFFVREMECKRARLQEADRYQWLKQTIFYWLSGYGERPTRVMRWMTVIIVLFAWVQGALGLYDGETPVVGPGIDWLPSWAGVNSFVTALYFSMVTFTSLGYGDVRPAPWWLPRVLAGLEAMVGLALMALLMVCVVRKFSR